MKKVLYALLFLLPLLGAAQTETATKPKEAFIYHNNIKAKPGEIYVDKQKIDPDKTYLDPTNFDDVKIVKADADKNNKKAKGATFITRKSKPKLFTLTDMVKMIQAENEKIKDAKKVNVVINGVEIKDVTGYMIERSTIVKTEIKDANKKGATPTIEITTKNKKQ